MAREFKDTRKVAAEPHPVRAASPSVIVPINNAPIVEHDIQLLVNVEPSHNDGYSSSAQYNGYNSDKYEVDTDSDALSDSSDKESYSRIYVSDSVLSTLLDDLYNMLIIAAQ